MAFEELRDYKIIRPEMEQFRYYIYNFYPLHVIILDSTPTGYFIIGPLNKILVAREWAFTQDHGVRAGQNIYLSAKTIYVIFYMRTWTCTWTGLEPKTLTSD